MVVFYLKFNGLNVHCRGVLTRDFLKDVYWSRFFFDLRTFRAGQRLLPRDLTGNRIPAIILSLSRKPGPGFSKIRLLLFDSRFTSGRRKEYGLFFIFQR